MNGLNFDPADPQEREEQHLPPKSYADAAEEALDKTGADNGFDEDSIKETPPRRVVRKGSVEPRPLAEMLDDDERSHPSVPSTPVNAQHGRFSDSHSSSSIKSYAHVAEDGVNTDAHPMLDLHEGHGESFSGEGLDASPKSPATVVRPHKRTSSRSSNYKKSPERPSSQSTNYKKSPEIPSSRPSSNSSNYKSPERPSSQSTNYQKSPEIPSSQSTNYKKSPEIPSSHSTNSQKSPEIPSSHSTNYQKSPEIPSSNSSNHQKSPEIPSSHSSNHQKSPERQQTKSISESSDGQQKKLVYEKFESPDGKQLTSVKPDDSYESELRLDEEEAKPQDKVEKSREALVSGKRAGATWDNSIRWAPLKVPVQRRLQTGMVLLHTLSIALFLALFFLLCTLPLLWPLLLPYLCYVLFSKAGTSGSLSYRSERLRRLPIWSLFASYFPARLHRSQSLPATRKYVFGYHPHGIISHGAFVAFATEALGFSQLFPGIKNTLLTLDSNFRIPLYRDWALRLGLASVSRESCENILSKGGPNNEGMGRAITIVVGGARESLDAQPHSLRLVLARRKGFVKLAIRTGADLVPVLAFGENELYEQFDPQAHPRIHKFQLLVKKALGFTVPLFHARGVFNYDVGMMPYRRPLNIVVGRPVMVQRQQRPDARYVDEIHAQYVDELVRVWDEWKDIFAKNRHGELEIVE